MSARLKQHELDPNNLQHHTKDMMHFIIQASESQQDTAKLSRAELDADASLLIAAGSDTTAVTLSALFFYLTQPTSRAIMSTLQTEIRDTKRFPTTSSLTPTSTTTLPYLRASIDEALRLAPTIPTHIPRVTIQETVIDQHSILTGTVVGSSAYVLHHDETVYPEPSRFNPDRWLIDANLSEDHGLIRQQQIARARRSFIPCGLCSRACVGRELAYREMSYVMAQIIYDFDFERASSHADDESSALRDVHGNEYRLYDCFLADRVGPLIWFRRSKWCQ